MLKKIFISAILLIAVLSFVVSLLNGKNSKQPVITAQPTIAVINMSGVIISGEDNDSIWGQSIDGVTSGRVMRQIRAASKDDNVKAILLRIDSPGGSVTATEEIGRELKRFKDATNKPIVASMGNTAASAGYWLAACQSDKIYANESTLTGSIGVYMPYTNIEELYNKIGLRSDKIKSGPYKDILSPDRPMTPEERTILQNMVNEMYNQFVQTIAAGRKMDVEKVKTLADGRVYTGKQALELGLVDEIGNYYDALAATGNMVGLGDTPQIKSFDNTKVRWQSVFGAQLQQIFKTEMVNFLKNAEIGDRIPRAEG